MQRKPFGELLNAIDNSLSGGADVTNNTGCISARSRKKARKVEDLKRRCSLFRQLEAVDTSSIALKEEKAETIFGLLC